MFETNKDPSEEEELIMVKGFFLFFNRINLAWQHGHRSRSSKTSKSQ